MRFYHFKRFVHHGGGVDGNLAAHHPIGMRNCLFGRYIFQGFDITPAKRAARSRENNFLYPGFPSACVFWQRLKDGGVFAVNRDQCGATLLNRLQKYIGTDNQRLFVRQQQTFA